jgi:hypothetical protein
MGLNDQYPALKAQLKHNQNAPRMSLGEKKTDLQNTLEVDFICQPRPLINDPGEI